MNNSPIVGISVPVKANTLAMLVTVLTTGVTNSDNKDELLDVIEAAESIGIYLYRYELSDGSGAESNLVQTDEDSLESVEKENHKEVKKEIKCNKKSEKKLAIKKRGRPIGSIRKIIRIECKQCDQTFDKKREMKKHECMKKPSKIIEEENTTVSIDGDKPKQKDMSCKLCDETFKSRGDLNYHMTSEQCV